MPKKCQVMDNSIIYRKMTERNFVENLKLSQ